MIFLLRQRLQSSFLCWIILCPVASKHIPSIVCVDDDDGQVQVCELRVYKRFEQLFIDFCVVRVSVDAMPVCHTSRGHTTS